MKIKISFSFVIILTFNIMNNAALGQEYEYRYDKINYNSEGKLEGLHTYTGSEGVEYTDLYLNGVLQESIEYKIIIEGKSPLQGIFKDGKPYEGYFVNRDDNMELNITDYYEDGTQVAQYSKPINFAEEEIDYNSAKYKTTYKFGKVWNGVQYHQYHLEENTFLLATENYKEGKRQHVDLLLGAVHYAAFLKLEFLDDGYRVTEAEGFENPGGTMVVSFSAPGKGKVTLTPGHQFEFYNAAIEEAFQKKWGILLYYKTEDKFYYQHTHDMKINYDEYYDNSSAIKTVFDNLMNNKVVFLNSTQKNDYSLLFEREFRGDFHNKLILIKDGTPFMGVLIEKGGEADAYNFTKYKKEEIISSQQNITSEELVEQANYNHKDFTETLE